MRELLTTRNVGEEDYSIETMFWKMDDKAIYKNVALDFAYNINPEFLLWPSPLPSEEDNVQDAKGVVETVKEAAKAGAETVKEAAKAGAEPAKEAAKAAAETAKETANAAAEKLQKGMKSIFGRNR